MTHAEKYLKENLLPEEKVLWSGKPEKVNAFEKPFGMNYVIRCIISAALIAFAIWYWFYALGIGFNVNMPVTMTIIMLAIAAYLTLQPIFSARRLASRCLYAITDQHAMIVYNVNPGVARSRELSAVMGSSYDTLSTGCGTIYIGEKTKAAPRKARDLSLIPDMPDDELPLMFYSVPDPASIFAILTKSEANAEDEGETVSA